MFDGYYHCANTTEAKRFSLPLEELQAVPVTFLCGNTSRRNRSGQPTSFDFPKHFIEGGGGFSGWPVCQTCRNHPDLPMLVLADMDGSDD